MTHSLQDSTFKTAAGTVCYWSRRPRRRLLLFVHGYRGHAEETWSDFPRLLRHTPETAGADLCFYGYNAANCQIDISASLLSDFLGALSRAAFRYRRTFHSDVSANESPWDDVYFVAHSLGAVIVRKCLLDDITYSRPRPYRTRMVLYAPAHLGTTLLDPHGAGNRLTSGWLAEMMRVIGRRATPVLDQLRQGSPALKKLLTETKQALARGNAHHLVARMVVFGEFEDVVVVSRFLEDPQPRILPHRTHYCVCKPTDMGDDRMQCLMESLS